jgi:hypothetical protein
LLRIAEFSMRLQGQRKAPPPNSALQRSCIHKLQQPMGWRAAAELGR